MDHHLVCVHPFGKYAKGQRVTDEAEVAELLDDREHHFVRIAVPAAEPVTVILSEESAAEKPPSTRSIPRQS